MNKTKKKYHWLLILAMAMMMFLGCTVANKPPGDFIVTISSTFSNPTGESPIPVRVVFERAVTEFALTDLTITGGSGQLFSEVSSMEYTFQVIPQDVTADIVISMAEGIVDGVSGGQNLAASFSIRYDLVPSISSLVITKAGNDSVEMTWSVTADQSDIDHFELSWSPGSGSKEVAGDMTNDMVTGLTNGIEYTFTLHAVDNGGNTSNQLTDSIDLLGSTIKDVYYISTAEELNAMRNDLDGYYILKNDIDLSTFGNWSPIGSSGSNFTGILHGKNHAISNCTISLPSSSNIGFFSYTSSAAQIRDLTMDNMNVTGSSNVGGLVGNNSAYINNCYVDGNVQGNVSGNNIGVMVGQFTISSNMTIDGCHTSGSIPNGSMQKGGLFGYVYVTGTPTVTITNCYSTVAIDVIATGYRIGGLIGEVYTENSGTVNISDCYATGNITPSTYGSSCGGFIGRLNTINGTVSITRCHATGNITGGSQCGGFVGSTQDSTTITYCYATGNVMANGYMIGGFVGMTQGTFRYCYATGNARGTSDTSYGTHVGGFVGNQSYATMTDCYARGATSAAHDGIGAFSGLIFQGTNSRCYGTGDVTSDTTGIVTGGFNGVRDLGYGTINLSCFWDTETTGQSTSDGGTGHTTAEMKTEATFTAAGYDFTTVWAIDPAGIINDGYPYLRDLEP